MKIFRQISLLMASALFAGLAYSAETTGPVVELTTNQGTIAIQLNAEKAPESSKNFVRYVNAGFYDGLVFHRVIPGFMAQGGGYDKELKKKDTQDAIKNESKNGLKNKRGTIAMARTSAPHSATSQFFINLVDNKFLDPQGSRWGYAVFGEVIEGMDVVDKIAKIPTGKRGKFSRDVPKTDVVIEKATVRAAQASADANTILASEKTQ